MGILARNPLLYQSSLLIKHLKGCALHFLCTRYICLSYPYIIHADILKYNIGISRHSTNQCRKELCNSSLGCRILCGDRMLYIQGSIVSHRYLYRNKINRTAIINFRLRRISCHFLNGIIKLLPLRINSVFFQILHRIRLFKSDSSVYIIGDSHAVVAVIQVRHHECKIIALQLAIGEGLDSFHFKLACCIINVCEYSLTIRIFRAGLKLIPVSFHRHHNRKRTGIILRDCRIFIGILRYILGNSIGMGSLLCVADFFKGNLSLSIIGTCRYHLASLIFHGKVELTIRQRHSCEFFRCLQLDCSRSYWYFLICDCLRHCFFIRGCIIFHI